MGKYDEVVEDWNIISNIIKEVLVEKCNLDVAVYVKEMILC